MKAIAAILAMLSAGTAATVVLFGKTDADPGSASASPGSTTPEPPKAPIEAVALTAIPAAREPAPASIADLQLEVQQLTSALEDVTNENWSLQYKVHDLQEEVNRLHWAATGNECWLQFMQTPLFQELTEEQRGDIQWVFERIGEPLEDWQIRGLAEYLPESRRHFEDWRNRDKEAKESGVSPTDPVMVALSEERHALIREEDAKLHQFLCRQDIFDRYTGNTND